MKIVTEKGQLELPANFSLTLERNNPLFSAEGDSSIPTSLPASSHNMRVLGHYDRVDRADRYINKVPAIITSGPVTKKGSLVIDTVHRRNGIEASFAIDNSDLYAKAKSKSLKDIFREYNDGQGYTQTFASVKAAAQAMQAIYSGAAAETDYTIFPVAVAIRGGGGDVSNYDYNNEVSGSQALVYQARIIQEGDIQMSVPEGYGLAPFLLLHRLINRIFHCLGYNVIQNCFAEVRYQNIAIVHNCADALVTPTLHYCDMAPSCTLSEFLEWLQVKFNVQPFIDSSTRWVYVRKMEAVLDSSPPMDISDLVDDGFTVQTNRTSRIVLKPTNSIEGTEPAEPTFDKLIRKYGGYISINESEFISLFTSQQTAQDCLALRKATGQFYLLERTVTGATSVRLLGTNHFTYDRENSEDTKEMAQNDIMPLMTCHEKMGVAPFIGKRLHFHTAYENQKEETEQPIIVVQRIASSHFVYKKTGTTQKFIPKTDYTEYELDFDMTPHGMYDDFWQRYNTLLLNNEVRLTGRLQLCISQFINMGFHQNVLYKHQRLVPIKTSAKISDKISLSDAEFILNKSFRDGITDQTNVPLPTLRWQVQDNSEQVFKILYETYHDDYERQLIQELNEDIVLIWEEYDYDFTDGLEAYHIGMPLYEGQVGFSQVRTATFTIHGVIQYLNGSTSNNDETFTGQHVNYSIVAVHV